MSSARAYVTYYDQRYLSRALVMLRSLRNHDPETKIFTLCFDQTAYEITAELGDRNTVVISSQTIRDFEPTLAACENRTRHAFYATHKPVLPLYVLSQQLDLAAIAHIDADTCFFSSPAPLFEEIGEASIAVSPHRLVPALVEPAKQYGPFNAGFIYWRNDPIGRRCLADYRADCLEWCEPQVEPDGRFMNQGYLTAWPERYEGVHIIQHPGVNLATWNIAGHSLAQKKGVVTVDSAPLVFYHFTDLLQDSTGTWRTLYRDFGDNLRLALRAIYRPYLEEVEWTEHWLQQRVTDLLPLERPWNSEQGIPVRRGPRRRSSPTA